MKDWENPVAGTFFGKETMIKILVCGGRDYDDQDSLTRSLSKICAERGYWNDGHPNCMIISGLARGADTLALYWAKDLVLPTMQFPANWDKYGKSAGAIRNTQMLKVGQPDLVVAFPGGRGTDHMKSIARAAGVEVIQVDA